jgi:hypothetical protein
MGDSVREQILRPNWEKERVKLLGIGGIFRGDSIRV